MAADARRPAGIADGGAARLTEERFAEVVDSLLMAQGNVTDLWEKILQDESRRPG